MNVIGTVIPYIGRRNIPLNADGSVVDTGEFDLVDEVGPYFMRAWVFEWLGFGLMFGKPKFFRTIDGTPADELFRLLEGSNG